MLAASNIVFETFLGLSKLFSQHENVSSEARGESSYSMQELEGVPSAAEPLRIQVDVPESTAEIAPEEAQYFQDRLRAWYDRTDDVGGAAGKRMSLTLPPRSPFSPGRRRPFVESSTSFNDRTSASTSFSRRTQSLERKAVAGTSYDTAVATAPASKTHMASSQMDRPRDIVKSSSAFTAEQIRQRLGTIGKAELTSLIIEYHRALAELGHSSESDLLLEAALKHLKPYAASAEESIEDPNLSGVEKLLKDGLLAFLLRLQQNLPPLQSQVIKFKDLTYTGEVVAAEEQFPTVGSALLGCFLPCFRKGRQKETFQVLQKCSGYLMPGTLTLVCGPPGCGKTSLHKALAGRLVPQKGSKFSGAVTYNGKNLKDIFVRRIAAYIGQTDQHFPALTVRETCEFAYECTNLQDAEKALAGLAGEFGGKRLSLELTLHMLGLSGPADTIVGNPFVRGVSGGERHRVTTAEMIAGTYVVFFLDEISTGLDSSATYDIVSAVRMFSRIRQNTCLLSLLQPSPEVFDLIDRLIVLAEGRIIYQGPREDVLPYFAGLGYVKPSHVDVADFLQEVTTPEGKLFLQPGFKHLETESFEKAYKSSDLYRELLRIVDGPKVMQELWFQAEKPLGLKLRDGEGMAGEKNVVEICDVEPTGNVAKADIKQTSRVKEGDIITGVLGNNGRLEYIAGAECVYFAADVVKKVAEAEGQVRLQLERPRDEIDLNNRSDFAKEFVQDWWDSTRTVLSRQTKLLIRNRSFISGRFAQVLILGIFTGTLFYQVDPGPERSKMDLRKSLAFTASMAMALATVSQIPVIIDERKVFEKQYAARFFRPNSYVIATTLAQIPYSVVEIAVYCPLLYWLTGLSPAQHGVHFLMYVLLVFEAALMGAAMTKFLASICRAKESAMGLAGVAIIMFLMFSGFMITKNKVPDWWIWAYYLSPLQYGVTGLVCNEFLSGKYNQPCTSSIPYCAGRLDMTVGQAYLDLYQMPTNYFEGVWVPAIALMMYYAAFTCMTFLSMGRLRFDEVKLPSMTRVQQNRQGSTVEGKESHRLQNARMKNTVLRMETTISPPSVMTFEPVVFSFHQVTYEVVIQGIKDPRVLLSGVSGYARPGTMTALMGSSGAGKTTLLDVLAGRKTTGRIKGDILLNGYPKLQSTFARVSGYVEQNDIHIAFITVNEALEFSAALRLPTTTTASQRKLFVREVTDLLELQDVRNKLVGSIGDNGLSVEEAKRLTIGVELVANPSIIFFDEPTSGLDSRSAQVVMRGVSKIVRSGRSVICTVHQPSRRLFLAFDQLLLLKRGGEVAYFGPVGPEARDLLGYFHGLPGTRLCGEDQNPATYMLDLIGAGIGHSADRDYGVDYRESSLFATNWEELETLRYGKGTLGAEPVVRGYAASWSTMFSCVLRRQYRTYWRNVAYSFGRICFAMILAVMLGTAFWQKQKWHLQKFTAVIGWLQIKYDNTPGLVSRGGLVYMAIIFMSIMNANNVIPQVNAERPVFYRESASRMYSSLVYSIAWVLAEVPYLGVSTLVFCGICFSMSAVTTDSASRFFQFWFIFFEYSACITFFGILLAMMTPNAETATVVVPVVINLWNMTSGFMIAKKDIPNFWIWLYWLNPTQYALNGGGLVAWLIMEAARSLEYHRIGFDMGMLAVFTCIFSVAGIVALRFMRFNRR